MIEGVPNFKQGVPEGHLKLFSEDVNAALTEAVKALQSGDFVSDYQYLNLEEEDVDNWCVGLDYLLGRIIIELQQNPSFSELSEENEILKHLQNSYSVDSKYSRTRLHLFAAAGVPRKMMEDYLIVGTELLSDEDRRVLDAIYDRRLN